MRMNLNEAPPPYLQQLINQADSMPPMVMKSEDDHDYTNPTLPFMSGDCAYFGTDQTGEFLNMPNNFSNANSLFNSVTCTPNLPIMSTPVQPSLNTRPRVNAFPQNPRMGMPLPGMLLANHNHMEQLPDTTNFPGEYNFQLSLGPHTESATKSADYTYSPTLKKLYVQRGAQCPFMFKTASRPPPNTHVKILPVFKGTHVLSEPVRRCSNHAEGEEDDLAFADTRRYHFVRASNRQTQYEHSDGGRLFVTMPYTGPQVGAEFQVELLSFMCFNSCGHSSHSRRRIDVIFMLECNGHVLGRQVIEVRVCACPGRDRGNEECGSPKSGYNKMGKRGMGTLGGLGKNGKRRKLSSNGDQDYTITTNNPTYYRILSQILDTLESQLPQIDIHTLVNENSPISSASSPGNVFKALQEIETTDDEINNC